MSLSPGSPPPQVRCRQIGPDDLEAVADLLTRGFPARPRKYWTTALQRLEARPAPDGCPQFGYLLEAGGRVVGALLLIFSERDGHVRCNLSSWYVLPEHRGHAALMAAMATKLKHVTYLNTSPAPHTWPILEAQGYVPLQRRPVPGAAGAGPRARPGAAADARRARPDAAGVRSAARPRRGRLRGAGLRQRRRRRAVRLPAPPHRPRRAAGDAAGLCAQHRQLRRLRRSARPLPGDARLSPGDLRRRRRRPRRRRALLFKQRGPRFFKGPERPRQNDLAFTEMVVFGP